jgi:hypothetical protein
MVHVKMGSARISHGSHASFATTLNQECTITRLYPAPGESTSCLGTLASKCAAYGKTNVVWNVREKQLIKRTDLPFTVTLTISFEAFKGEYYGDQYGQPAPDMSVWFYPSLDWELPPTPTPAAPPAAVPTVPTVAPVAVPTVPIVPPPISPIPTPEAAWATFDSQLKALRSTLHDNIIYALNSYDTDLERIKAALKAAISK